MSRASRRDRALMALLALVLAWLVPASAAGASEAAAERPIGAIVDRVAGALGDARATLDYWTPARMREARAPAQPAASRAGRRSIASGGYSFRRSAVENAQMRPFRAHGRVFFTLPGEGDFSCSGTVVRTPSRSVVMTAAHCAVDARSGTQASRWMFVPAYEDGHAPFGRWVAHRLFVPRHWSRSGDPRFDVAFARMRPDDRGRRIQRVTGSRRIVFGTRGAPIQAFGYPVAMASLPFVPSLEFDGRRQWACESPYAGGDPRFAPPQPLSIACDMGSGSSGGAWLDPAGRIVSVTSYGYLLLPLNRAYGPFLGSPARRVFAAVRGRLNR